MKWVKVAIGAVIAIAVVPMIVISVFNLTQAKVREEVVSFTINVTEETYTPINVFDDILLYAVKNESDVYDNITVVKYNNIVTTDYTFSFADINTFSINSISLDDFDQIDKNGNYIIVGGLFSDNDTFEITFEVTQAPILSGVTATLLLLAPLIFVSGILYFIYNNKQEGI